MFVDKVRDDELAPPHENEVGRNTIMNETLIEAQARYLIEDRIRATRPRRSAHDRRRHRRLRMLSWL